MIRLTLNSDKSKPGMRKQFPKLLNFTMDHVQAHTAKDADACA
jgi:hypothetical protein